MVVWAWQLQELDSLCAEKGATRGDLISTVLTAYRLFLEKRKATGARLVAGVRGKRARFVTTLAAYQVNWLDEMCKRGHKRSEVMRDILDLFFGGYLNAFLPAELQQGEKK